MNYLVAVSGGVDSVVLLDMLSKTNHQCMVGHVDHGIRGDDSAADARFVQELAKRYGMRYVTTELKLGKDASEATAREARYEFLLAQAKAHGAMLATAHHLDDIIETMVINLERGTGWRGLAVLGRQDVARPLVKFTKAALYDYATTQRLEWVEDETNASAAYHRNRVRHAIPATFAHRDELAKLREIQLKLKDEIAEESTRLLDHKRMSSRYFFTCLESAVALELLGALISAYGVPRPPRPRLERALLMIKTAKPATTFELGDGVYLRFTSRTFAVKAL